MGATGKLVCYDYGVFDTGLREVNMGRGADILFDVWRIMSTRSAALSPLLTRRFRLSTGIRSELA